MQQVKPPRQTSLSQTPPTYRQTMAPVHKWFGLLLGWILFIIFLAGSLSFFMQEITVWMQPEVPYSQVKPNERHIMDAIDQLAVDERTKNAKSWMVYPSSERNPNVFIYLASPEDEWQQYVYQTAEQRLIFPRQTEGGDFLYALHYDLYHIPYPYSRYLVGIAAMMMLIALITGVIVHRNLFGNFFTFRWGKGQRSWLDAHNALSVLPLPFHLMMTFTGLVIFASTYMPWAVERGKIDIDELDSIYYAYRDNAEETKPKTMPSLQPLIQQTLQAWDKPIERIRINDPNTDKATLIINGRGKKQISDVETFRIYDIHSGEIMATHKAEIPAAFSANGIMVGLHSGRFASIGLRWIYFLCGLCGTAMIATGLILWTAKRKKQLNKPNHFHVGFYLVERLNIATIVGFPIAIVGYLGLNRLIPTEIAERSQVEIMGMFSCWLAVSVVVCLLPVVRAWQLSLLTLSLTLLALPFINQFTTNRGFWHSLINHDLLFISVDLFCWVLAFVVWLTYRRYTEKKYRKTA